MSSADQIDLPDAADLALARIHQLGNVEGRSIYDPPLNRLLDPFRVLPALEIICSPQTCGRRLAWCAIDRGHAFVAATEKRAKPKQRRGGMSDLAQPDQPTGRFFPWIELAEAGHTTVRPVDYQNPSGFPLRLDFVGRCGHSHVTKNTTRLQAFLTAARSSNGRIHL